MRAARKIIAVLILGSLLQLHLNAQSFCNNLDFESSLAGPFSSSTQVSGWTITDGYLGWLNNPPPASNTVSPYFPNGKPVNTLCDVNACCPLPPYSSAVIDCSQPGGFVDNFIGSQYPIYSVFGSQPGPLLAQNVNSHLNIRVGGTKVLRLNNNQINDYSMACAKRQFTVTNTNHELQYAYMMVGQAGHVCCSSSGAQVQIFDVTATPFLIASLSHTSNPGGGCMNSDCFFVGGSGQPFQATSSSLNVYSKWIRRQVDLNPFIGQVIELVVTVNDCDVAGHFGYIYFDATCGPATPVAGELFFEGALVTPVNDSITLYSCQASPVFSATTGKPVWSINSSTVAGATFTASTSGNLTLKHTRSYNCSDSVKTIHINLIVAPTISVTTSNTLLCMGTKATLSTNATSGITWSTGETTSTILVSPNGNTTYSVTGSIGPCTHTTSFQQLVTNCSGLPADAGSVFRLYPNPAGKVVYLDYSGDEGNLLFVLENMLGQEMLRKSCPSDCSIEVGEIPAGVYIGKIYADDQLKHRAKLYLKSHL